MKRKMSFAVLLLALCGSALAADELQIDARRRIRDADGNDFVIVNKCQKWEPSETAVIVCDMWNHHWCKGAESRTGELAGPINEFVGKARDKGVFIIHAPSSTVEHYKDHPARKRAQGTPAADNVPADINGWCRWMDENEKAVYPIDQSDGGCDCVPKCKGGSPWTRQIDGIEISDADAITDSGVETWNLLEKRGIDNVMLLGVHTNMCVLGRPFGLRNMSRYGKNVVLVRDLTDTMYNSQMEPFVDHFTGTDLIVEHIEKNVCPTIVSTDVTERGKFGFKEDSRLRIVFVIAENEYDADRTLPAFANELQVKHDFACEFALGVSKSDDAKERNYISNMQLLEDADLAIVYVRRRALPSEQMKYLRDYVDSGRPLIGLRTASHAFALRGEKPGDGYAEWAGFDPEVLGGNYHGHHGNKEPGGPQTFVWVKPGAESHPILKGVPKAESRIPSWLYKTLPLTDSTKVLMMGRVDDRMPHEPVAWTNTTGAGGRVFYTSLGHPDDFEIPAFRRMLTNAVFWAMKKSVPAE